MKSESHIVVTLSWKHQLVVSKSFHDNKINRIHLKCQQLDGSHIQHIFKYIPFLIFKEKTLTKELAGE